MQNDNTRQIINEGNLDWFRHTCIRDLSFTEGGFPAEFRESRNYFRFDTVDDAFFQAENGIFYMLPEHIREEHFLNISEAEIKANELQRGI